MRAIARTVSTYTWRNLISAPVVGLDSYVVHRQLCDNAPIVRRAQRLDLVDEEHTDYEYGNARVDARHLGVTQWGCLGGVL